MKNEFISFSQKIILFVSCSNISRVQTYFYGDYLMSEPTQDNQHIYCVLFKTIFLSWFNPNGVKKIEQIVLQISSVLFTRSIYFFFFNTDLF